MQVNTEESPKYETIKISDEDKIIEKALEILQKRIKAYGETVSSQAAAKAFLRLKLATEESEKFCAIFLTAQHNIISFETLFNGTIDSCSVYPREAVKRCLENNASAVIFAHNHPSGCESPSQADRNITDKLKQALDIFGVRVLDHFIVAGYETYSFAEHGLI